ncbi:hypothetical protein [Paraburkholderia sp. BCC1886]|uniref:hypothetical protein n=1 Tax=Paraburkholderia sp. BCC1886 TaxID=2562670 RepID=UPI001183C43B|nr:hypothetical protein [Paraburkholderia sp. BCC1886]
MAPRPPLSIDSIRGFELTGDGQYLMLNTNQPSSIALHCSVMQELLAALANAIGVSQRIRSKKKSVKFAMPCEAWEVGGERSASTHLILTFRVPGGAELSFRVPRTQAVHLTEVLALASGAAVVGDLSDVTMQ